MAESFTFETVHPKFLEKLTVPDEIRERIQFVPELGFMAIAADDDKVQVVGFHGDTLGAQWLEPLALRKRVPHYQTLDHNAKGAGIMLGNSLESIRRPDHQPRMPGLYRTPALSMREIATLHHEDPYTLAIRAKGLARHAGLIVVDRTIGVDAAARLAERPYRDSNLATIDPAPTWLQAQDRTKHVVTPVWALWRDIPRRRVLTKIGSVTV